MPKFLIIGAGAAGINAAATLRKMDGDAEITVVSIDDQVHSRCMLHKVLGQERTEQKINFVSEEFFESNNIRWVSTEAVTQVNTEERRITLSCGAYLEFEKLLICTGCEYSVPPIPHFREAGNVYGFRDISDIRKIDKALERGKNVFIVGSGLVGLDAAAALCRRGARVTIAEMADRVMPLQTDAYAASVYQKVFEQAGCSFRLGIGANDSIVDEEGNITGVILANGEVVPCDFIIAAAGVRPRIEFLKDSGMETDRGVLVDEYLETSVSGIYAAGDVTGLSGVWPDAVEQGKTAAMNMCGIKVEYEKPYPFKNTSNFYGVTMLSLGKLDASGGGCEVICHRDADNYKKAVLKDGVLQGLLIQGDISNSGVYLYLVRNQISVSGLNKNVFQLSFADFYGIDERTAAYEFVV